MNNLLGSIFLERWWLEAVAPRSWSQVVVSRNGQEMARMPYVHKASKGLSRVTMPPLTQLAGPILRANSEKYANRLSREKEWITELIDHLPRFDLLKLNLDPAVFNGLPFHWKGFHLNVGYTYVLGELNDVTRLWGGLQERTRRQIKKGVRSLKLRDDLGVEELLRQIRMTNRRIGRRVPFDETCFRRLSSELERRGQGRGLFAVDAQGRVHSAIYLVWDENAMHYLVGGGDPELRNSGAASFLLWEAIKSSGSVTKAFNFEGSMVESVERFFRSFGAVQVPYIQISAFSWKARYLNALRTVVYPS